MIIIVLKIIIVKVQNKSSGWSILLLLGTFRSVQFLERLRLAARIRQETGVLLRSHNALHIDEVKI